MNEIYQIISQPWPWYVAGPAIGVVMFVLLWFGNSFGVSSNFRTICAMSGGGANCEFFRFNWRKQIWNLVFLAGSIVGGYIASNWLSTDNKAHISYATIAELDTIGVNNPGESLVPEEIFSFEALLTTKGLIMLVLGGFLVGFGTRYAGGCTSGHAISGLSNLQLPSLIAVVGFFIGGLFTTYFILPYLLAL